MKRFTAVLIVVLASPVWAEVPNGPGVTAKAKNVILFLGDGTGLPSVSAASILGHGKPQALYVQKLPHVGLSDTSTASNWVSDSAAGMTAIVTGYKTHNGVVSQSVEAQRGVTDGLPLKTILEYAEERGLATGVVSNSPITDATPAACYAHSNDRGKWGEIFSQVFQPRFGDGVDVVIGPGRTKIFEQTASLGLDIAAQAQSAGYVFLDQPDCLCGVAEADRVIALSESRPYDFDLAEATQCALDILRRDPDGFFLMVESNNHFMNVRESLELIVRFDEIIKSTAEQMADTDTLILFTADHSYDILFPKAKPKGEDILDALTVGGSHTAEEVPVMAQGPGAERVRGFFPNTHLFHVMMAAYGWTPDGAFACCE